MRRQDQANSLLFLGVFRKQRRDQVDMLLGHGLPDRTAPQAATIFPSLVPDRAKSNQTPCSSLTCPFPPNWPILAMAAG